MLEHEGVSEVSSYSKSNQKDQGPYGLQVPVSAGVLVLIQVQTTGAPVTWNLSVALGHEVVTIGITHGLLVGVQALG